MMRVSLGTIVKSAFTILAITLLVSTTALAAKTGTVTLKDGTVFENVTFSTDPTYKIIEFKFEDQKKNVSFTDIESIVDPSGEDITEAVSGGYYKAEKNEEFLSETSEAYKHARRKLWKIGLSLGGNYTFPGGDYYQDINPGIGFDVDLTLALTYNLAFRLSISQTGMDYEKDLAYMLVNSIMGDTLVVSNLGFSSISYFLSFQYYNRPDRVTPGKMIYHFYSGLGAVAHKLESDAVLIRTDGTQIRSSYGSYEETKFAMTFGGGLTRMVSEAVGIYAAANMDMVVLGTNNNDSFYWQDNLDWAYQFDLKAGFTLFAK